MACMYDPQGGINRTAWDTKLFLMADCMGLATL